jgi:hypothetical protein
MKWMVWVLLALLTLPSATAADVILLMGAPGTEEYAARFEAMAETWSSAASKHSLTKLDTSEALTQHVKKLPPSEEPLWLVLIGHGSSDPRSAHFNLKGPDLSPAEVSTILAPLKREVILVDNTAASGGFIKALSGPKRVLVTATKGAEEVWFTRFGQFFATAIGGLEKADQDQDKQVSVLEAFLFASHETRGFYEKEGRIATEHALLDDNGDGDGTRAEAFTAKGGERKDGLRAKQLHLVMNPQEQAMSPDIRAKRDALEAQVRVLVEKKATLSEDDYYQQLEALFLEIARLMKST